MKKYSGSLSKPRPHLVPLGLLATREHTDARSESEVREAVELMNLLFAHYNVAPGNWAGAAFALAYDHVPAFRRAGPTGRKGKWDVLIRAQLAVAIDKLVLDRGVSASTAAVHLARKEPWKSLLSTHRGSASDALRKQYEAADPRWTKVYRDSLAYDEYLAKIDEGKTEDEAFAAAELLGREKTLVKEDSREITRQVVVSIPLRSDALVRPRSAQRAGSV